MEAAFDPLMICLCSSILDRLSHVCPSLLSSVLPNFVSACHLFSRFSCLLFFPYSYISYCSNLHSLTWPLNTSVSMLCWAEVSLQELSESTSYMCCTRMCVCLCTLLSVHPACCLYCPHSYLWQKPFLTQRGKADIFQGDISYFKIHSKYFWAWGMELDYATFPLLLLLPFPPSYCSFLYVIIHKTSW